MLKGFLRESSYGFVEYNAFPRSSDPIYIVSYYLKWVTTSWTHSMYPCDLICNLSINIKNDNSAIESYSGMLELRRSQLIL